MLFSYFMFFANVAGQRAVNFESPYIPGAPGILTFIDKNIEPLIFLSFFGFAKTSQLLIT
jgi:hypothetical protein